MDRLYLYPQVVGHWRPVGLVVTVNFVAKGFALGIENHHQGTLRIILLHPAHHIDNTFYRAGRNTFAIGQRRERMKGAVEIGRPINEDQRGFCIHIVFLYPAMIKLPRIQDLIETSLKLPCHFSYKLTVAICG